MTMKSVQRGNEPMHPKTNRSADWKSTVKGNTKPPLFPSSSRRSFPEKRPQHRLHNVNIDSDISAKTSFHDDSRNPIGTERKPELASLNEKAFQDSRESAVEERSPENPPKSPDESVELCAMVNDNGKKFTRILISEKSKQKAEKEYVKSFPMQLAVGTRTVQDGKKKKVIPLVAVLRKKSDIGTFGHKDSTSPTLPPKAEQKAMSKTNKATPTVSKRRHFSLRRLLGRQKETKKKSNQAAFSVEIVPETFFDETPPLQDEMAAPEEENFDELASSLSFDTNVLSEMLGLQPLGVVDHFVPLNFSCLPSTAEPPSSIDVVENVPAPVDEISAPKTETCTPSPVDEKTTEEKDSTNWLSSTVNWFSAGSLAGLFGFGDKQNLIETKSEPDKEKNDDKNDDDDGKTTEGPSAAGSDVAWASIPETPMDILESILKTTAEAKTKALDSIIVPWNDDVPCGIPVHETECWRGTATLAAASRDKLSTITGTSALPETSALETEEKVIPAPLRNRPTIPSTLPLSKARKEQISLRPMNRNDTEKQQNRSKKREGTPGSVKKAKTTTMWEDRVTAAPQTKPKRRFSFSNRSAVSSRGGSTSVFGGLEDDGSDPPVPEHTHMRHNKRMATPVPSEASTGVAASTGGVSVDEMESVDSVADNHQHGMQQNFYANEEEYSVEREVVPPNSISNVRNGNMNNERDEVASSRSEEDVANDDTSRGIVTVSVDLSQAAFSDEYEVLDIFELPDVPGDDNNEMNDEENEGGYDGGGEESLGQVSSRSELHYQAPASEASSVDYRSQGSRDSFEMSVVDPFNITSRPSKQEEAKVEEAIKVFRKHALLLGVDERDLLLAVQQTYGGGYASISGNSSISSKSISTKQSEKSQQSYKTWRSYKTA